MNKYFKKTVLALTAGSIMFVLGGCGKQTSDSSSHEELASFRTEINNFCSTIAKADSEINSIDAESDTDNQILLSNLDSLNTEFSDFSALDFPSDYDYLEPLADEAADYMNTAVTAYHDLFENDYDSSSIDSVYTYASENYARAYKRVNVIVTFLNGEISDDVTITESQ